MDRELRGFKCIPYPFLNKKKHGSVRTFVALVEDPGLTAGTHMMVDNHSKLS